MESIPYKTSMKLKSDTGLKVCSMITCVYLRCIQHHNIWYSQRANNWLSIGHQRRYRTRDHLTCTQFRRHWKIHRWVNFNLHQVNVIVPQWDCPEQGHLSQMTYNYLPSFYHIISFIRSIDKDMFGTLASSLVYDFLCLIDPCSTHRVSFRHWVVQVYTG